MLHKLFKGVMYPQGLGYQRTSDGTMCWLRVCLTQHCDVKPVAAAPQHHMPLTEWVLADVSPGLAPKDASVHLNASVNFPGSGSLHSYP